MCVGGGPSRAEMVEIVRYQYEAERAKTLAYTCKEFESTAAFRPSSTKGLVDCWGAVVVGCAELICVSELDTRVKKNSYHVRNFSSD